MHNKIDRVCYALNGQVFHHVQLTAHSMDASTVRSVGALTFFRASVSVAGPRRACVRIFIFIFISHAQSESYALSIDGSIARSASYGIEISVGQFRSSTLSARSANLPTRFPWRSPLCRQSSIIGTCITCPPHRKGPLATPTLGSLPPSSNPPPWPNG